MLDGIREFLAGMVDWIIAIGLVLGGLGGLVSGSQLGFMGAIGGLIFGLISTAIPLTALAVLSDIRAQLKNQS
ncbi:hypothetical protein [Thiohalorhabdus methylotrophus]|uniref:Uncharacterized protein n=1 Tax=Thiohalorhabdus methylotrophus TaxID=3242694 RepID=A0ABV4TYK2_9GAMM